MSLRSPQRQILRAVGLGALVVVLVVPTLGGGSAAAQDTRQERARVQRERAQVAGQVDALKGDQAQVTAALGALDADVRTQEASVAEATRLADTAAAEAEAARAAAVSSAAELEELRVRLTRMAVDAYVDPPGEELLRRLQAGSAQEDATRRALLAKHSGRDLDLIDQVRVAERRHRDDERRAEGSRVAAEVARAEAQGALTTLLEARAGKQAFAEQVRQRLDERLSDAASLARLDAGLAARIVAEENAIAEAVARAAPPTPPGSGGGGGGTGGGTGGSTPPTAPRGPRPTVPALRTVGGITVAASIADQVSALLAAARSAGIVLAGSGYRDMNAQIALRRQNCGTSDYATWDMPADQCRPPTARPGLSMHERGLAIDFTSNGRFITSRSDPGFVWLAANAGRFGLVNLPSEPWHWSTNGS